MQSHTDSERKLTSPKKCEHARFLKVRQKKDAYSAVARTKFLTFFIRMEKKTQGS